MIYKTIGFLEPFRELGNEARRWNEFQRGGDRPLQGEIEHMNSFSVGEHKKKERKTGILIDY